MFFHRTWQGCNYINDTVCAYTSIYYTLFNFHVISPGGLKYYRNAYLR